MWQVASRRLKDTVERTFNALGGRQTWNFGVDNDNTGTNEPKSRKGLLTVGHRADNDTHNIRQETERLRGDFNGHYACYSVVL